MSKITETITSPNQSSRCGYIPQLIVCHIADGTYEGTKSWFNQSASATSSHFIVAQEGRICQCVDLAKMAWCNGTTTSSGDNRYFGHSTVPLVKELGSNANYYSVSIEHEGYHSKTNGALTDAQLAATIWLIGYIREQVKALYGYDIPVDREHIVGHYEINPITKPLCPGASFPWAAVIEGAAGGTVDIPDEESPVIEDDPEIVMFAGGDVHVSSDAAESSGKREASLCEVTAHAKGAPHPYHLISVDDGQVYGWVNASLIVEPTGGIGVGSLVKVTGQSYATGEDISPWVFKTTHKVSRIADGKALLGADGGINSWVHLVDLELA